MPAPLSLTVITRRLVSSSPKSSFSSIGMSRYASNVYSDILPTEASPQQIMSQSRDKSFEALHKAADILKSRKRTRESLNQHWQAKDVEKQQSRRWRDGDVYAPHDLSPVETRKWRRRARPTTDAFDTLAMNPLNEYKNFSIMSEYMTDMGRIKHSSETGLRPVNQRRIAKAIRRSIGLGIMPSVHRHPELLEMQSKARLRRGPGRR